MPDRLLLFSSVIMLASIIELFLLAIVIWVTNASAIWLYYLAILTIATTFILLYLLSQPSRQLKTISGRYLLKRDQVVIIGTAPLFIPILCFQTAYCTGNLPALITTSSALSSVILLTGIYLDNPTRLFILLSRIPSTREHDLRRQTTRLYNLSISTLLGEGKLELSNVTEDYERRIIETVIETTAGNKKHAARLLGISRATLYRKLDRV